jgi:hypothetical protein
MKAPLAIVLAATQLFASSASPLYLCLSADGSACIDFGPETCCCCQHGHEHAHAGTADHDACCDRPHVDDPCGCKHVQISEPHSVTRMSDADGSSCTHHVVSVIAIPCHAVRLVDVISATESGESRCWLHAPPPALSLLATVIIRC